MRSAVVLGAREFPHLQGEIAVEVPAFSNSANAITAYFRTSLQINESRILDLFDSESNSAEQLICLDEFLSETKPDELFIYYVGHGAFLPRNDFYLLCRGTRAGNESGTGLILDSLAHLLRERCRHARVFLILDCCFAAAATKSFQGPAVQAIVRQTHQTLPRRGTALLAASSANSVAVSPEGAEFTLFTGALLHALTTGIRGGVPLLSLSEVGELTMTIISESEALLPVRPEVHSPHQEEGDLARIPIFPNPGIGRAGRAPDSESSATEIQDGGEGMGGRIPIVFLGIVWIALAGMFASMKHETSDNPTVLSALGWFGLGLLGVPVLVLGGVIAFSLVMIPVVLGLVGVEPWVKNKKFEVAYFLVLGILIVGSAIYGQFAEMSSGDTVKFVGGVFARFFGGTLVTVVAVGIGPGIQKILAEEKLMAKIRRARGPKGSD